MPDDEERDRAYAEFSDAVTMTPAELRAWLDTDESKSVGMTPDGGTKSGAGGAESRGHESGRRILALLEKKKVDLDADDVRQMKRVTGYVHRHLAQRPTKEDPEHSRWRYSLMNWGHDPLK